MKRLILLLTIFFFENNLQAQTLFTYGSDAVSKDEFLRAFNKNNSGTTNREKAVRDYLDLYINFKLKVKAASVLQIDTLPQIKSDMANFHKQVEENYMTDEKAMQRLMDEAFIRSQKDLHLIHYSAPIGDNLTDTSKRYAEILNSQKALIRGDKDYEAIATANNLKYRDLGFITVFSLPYAMEQIVYNLKPGETSQPYRSKNAWHLFKLLEERPSSGKWKVAQILLLYPPNATEEAKLKVRIHADSIYDLLKSGADFEKMAREFSEDKLTYQAGGELPEFSTGKYDLAFESAVFNIPKDGEIAKPFTTAFGVHIVKRISHTATPSDKDNASMQYEHKQKILQDSRVIESKEQYSRQVMKRVGYKKVPAIKTSDLLRYADSVMADPTQDKTEMYSISSKDIILFEKGSVKGAEWLKFVQEFKSNPDWYKGETNAEIWDKFSIHTSMEYYRKNLEQYNADFSYQMQEFREGNMLFEVMERNVWSKAAIDSIGLRNYYNSHQSNYQWNASADIILINAINEETAVKAMDVMKQGKHWKALAEDSNGMLQADSGRYELQQILEQMQVTDTVREKLYSKITRNADGSAVFIKFEKVYGANQQRSFEEARGLVINDYQTVLENKWLLELKNKYPVKVNEPILNQIIKQ